jgi:hypothetical protein
MVQLVSAPNKEIAKISIDFKHSEKMIFRTSIASSNQDPWRFVGPNRIASRHRKIDIIGEVLEIINSLLDGVEFQALYTEIGQWVTEAIKPMLKDDGAAVLLLSLSQVSVRYK